MWSKGVEGLNQVSEAKELEIFVLNFSKQIVVLHESGNCHVEKSLDVNFLLIVY